MLSFTVICRYENGQDITSALFSIFDSLKFIFLDKFKIGLKCPIQKRDRNSLGVIPTILYFSRFYLGYPVFEIWYILFLVQEKSNLLKNISF